MSDPATTPENQNQLRLAVEQLKNAVSQCLGEEHECTTLIAQIEGTISDIEHKTSTNGKPKKARQSSKGVAAKPTVTPVHQPALQPATSAVS